MGTGRPSEKLDLLHMAAKMLHRQRLCFQNAVQKTAFFVAHVRAPLAVCCSLFAFFLLLGNGMIPPLPVSIKQAGRRPPVHCKWCWAGSRPPAGGRELPCCLYFRVNPLECAVPWHLQNMSILLETQLGNIALKLRPDLAPQTCQYISKIVSDGLYNGVCVCARARALVSACVRACVPCAWAGCWRVPDFPLYLWAWDVLS